MLIPVIYPNGTHDLVKDFYLDYLINSEKIEKFRRSSGWVRISAANVRSKNNRNYYSGPERRHQQMEDGTAGTTESAIIEFTSGGSFNND